MAKYCVNRNAQADGYHEVHNVTAQCRYLPDPENRRPLGEHATCHTAVAKAKTMYALVDAGIAHGRVTPAEASRRGR